MLQIELKRIDHKLYKNKSFSVISGGEKIGFLAPGESKTFEIDPKKPLKIKIDTLTGVRVDEVINNQCYKVLPSVFFAYTPIIWSIVLILCLIIPLVIESATNLSIIALGVAVLSYIPFISVLRYKWLKIQPAS